MIIEYRHALKPDVIFWPEGNPDEGTIGEPAIALYVDAGTCVTLEQRDASIVIDLSDIDGLIQALRRVRAVKQLRDARGQRR